MTSQELSRYGIGGSQAGAIIGVNRYQAPIDVWCEHFGEGEPFEGNEATEIGLAMEPAVCEMYSIRNDGVSLRIPERSIFAQGDESWMRATPDAFACTPTGNEDYGVEFKSSGMVSSWGAKDRWGESHSDRYPIEYRVQMLWYMHITGLDRWDLAALIGGVGYREYRIDRTPEVQAEIDSIVEDVTKFWFDHIIAEVAPPPDATASYARFLASRHPVAVTGEIVEADPVVAGSIAALREAKEDIRRAKSIILAHENIIKAAIGDDLGVSSDLGVVKWTERKGSVSWRKVALHLLDGMAVDPQQEKALTERHRGKPSRNLATPRGWGKE